MKLIVFCSNLMQGRILILTIFWTKKLLLVSSSKIKLSFDDFGPPAYHISEKFDLCFLKLLKDRSKFFHFLFFLNEAVISG